MSATVTVYNKGGVEVLGRVGLQHAILMITKGKARILEAVKGETFGGFAVPKAVELLRRIVAEWKYNRTGEVPFSKRGVLKRDGFTCAYCGKVGGSEMTVDHILPKWKGNAASWMNSITACRPCNQAKGGRSPREAGMALRFTPSVPSFAEAYAWSHPEG